MNLLVLSQSDNYDVGGLVRYLIKMFDSDDIIEIFKSNEINIITSKYIKNVLMKSDEEYLSEIGNNENYLIFGIHPYGLQTSINYAKNIKKIAWLNDPHYLAHFIERSGEIVQNYSKKYDSVFMDKIDYLITPSMIYFKNLGIDFYINWMSSEKGEIIANTGKDYVRSKFGKKYILEFIKLIKSLVNTEDR